MPEQGHVIDRVRASNHPPITAVVSYPAFAPRYPGKLSYLPANSPRPVDTAHIINWMSPTANGFVPLNAADKDADL